MNLLDVLQSRCTDASLKLDIGSNLGGYAFLMLDHPGQIHAFEAIPQLAAGVHERFKDEPRVTVFPFGVSDRECTDAGYAVFEAWTLDKPERAVRGRNAESLALGTFPITFVTVDDHLERQWTPVAGEHGVRERHVLSFMKLDTDGYELRVLKGATHALLHERPTILCEFNYMVQDIGDSIPEFLWLIFTKLNYVAVTEDGIVREHAYWLEHYPMTTTFDVGLIPVERLKEFGL